MSKSTRDHLKDYEDYLRIHNFSPSTVQAYKLGLRQFLEFRQAHNI
jgi:site-specific recombinase XerC